MSTNLKTVEKPTRPILRYHGGKWNLAEWIISFFPDHKAYVEPFGGAASVLLQKARSKSEVYNDLDGEITGLFRVLRDPAQARELRRLLELTLYARTEFESAFLTSADPIEAARRLIVRSFMGIGCNAVTRDGRGGIGKPQTGFRSVLEPNGALRARGWMEYPRDIKSFTERLRGVVIEALPALEAIRRFDSTRTLFYCDPPYPKSTRDKGNDYRFEMSDDEHRELAGELRRAQGLIVVSGYACALYDEELFADWHRESRAGFADRAKPRTEVLWLNDAAWTALNRERMQKTLFEQHSTSDI